MKKLVNGQLAEVKEELSNKIDEDAVNISSVIDNIWYDFTPPQYIGEAVIKYRKLSGQNILEICINGSNDGNISGDLNFGRLPVEYRPSGWGLLLGMLGVRVNGVGSNEIQYLNIGTDGRVTTGSFQSNATVKNFAFYGVINL